MNTKPHQKSVDRLDPKALHDLASNIEDIQMAGAGQYARAVKNRHGQAAVRFNGDVTVACRDEKEAEELIAKLNAAVGPIIAPFRDRYVAELHSRTQH